MLPALTIGASYGDALLAAYASGLLSRDQLSQWVKTGQTITPDPNHHQRYESLYADYLALYQQTREIVHHLSREEAGY